MQSLAITISALALIISAATAWLTLFRRGTIKMTRPSSIYFGPDGGPKIDRVQKVYLRTLLFSTSKSGRIIEAMYVSLRRNESRQNFSIWVHGDERLVRGSGLFVSESGIAVSHHFMTAGDDASFAFIDGTYQIEVFVKLVGDQRTLNLFSEELVVDAKSAKALAEEDCGLYFDWAAVAGSYISHIDKKRNNPKALMDLLAFARDIPSGS
ncbi:MAG TPA: hypothetical protein VIJ79_06265 [Acidobacteriaceae bacterium]